MRLTDCVNTLWACWSFIDLCIARSLSLQGWGLIDLPLRATFSPAHPLARQGVPSARARAFQDSSSLVKGSAKAALHCAHRTSTVSSCAFCEQEGRLAAPSSSFSGHVARAQKIIRLHPLLCSANRRTTRPPFLLFQHLAKHLCATIHRDQTLVLPVTHAHRPVRPFRSGSRTAYG